MKKLIFIIFICHLFSCTRNVNLIEIDILTEISTFPEYEKNLMFAQDMTSTNWNDLFKQEIDGFTNKETENLDFFINTQEDKKVVKIQLRTKSNQEPKHYSKIREIVLQRIKQMEVIYLENDKFISEASKFANQHLKLLDNKKYDSFFNLMPDEIQKQMTKEIKQDMIKGREALKINSSNRKFWFRTLNTTDTTNPENINVVQIYYLINNKGNNEFLTYQSIDDQIVLSGYYFK